MRQLLGSRKHRKCELATGKKYINCFVRGGDTHFVASCWYDDSNADWVNYKTNESRPDIRDGKFA